MVYVARLGNSYGMLFENDASSASKYVDVSQILAASNSSRQASCTYYLDRGISLSRVKTEPSGITRIHPIVINSARFPNLKIKRTTV